MTSIETVIRDAQAIVANGHTSSPDLIATTVKVLAQLFFLKLYKRHEPSHNSPTAIQEMIEYNNSLDATIAQLNLNTDKHQQLLHLVDTASLSQKQTSIDTDDEISHFYSSLLALLTPQNKVTGVYPTPQPIVRFMVKIVDPQPTDMKIYDPACGTCSLLAAAHTNMYPEGHEESIENCFFGCESNPNILSLGNMNMALHNIDITKLQLRDALALPLLQPSFFDENNTSNLDYLPVRDANVILTHPPQGRYSNSRYQTKLAWYDSWFLQHCMDTLKENGHCAIIVSDRTLSDPQTKHTELRRKLFTKFCIQLIVGLPPQTFGPLSGQKTYLLVFTAGQATQKILYYELPRKKEAIEYQDFQPILNIWEDWKNHLKNNAQLPVLPKCTWIETYDDLHHAELLRTQGKITKNPYKLYRPPLPQKYSLPADPKTLVGQILQQNQEIHDIALELQALLDQKEFLS